LDVIEASNKPVVFSHSNPYSLKKNNRNIHNELILACAKSNGVIGINGINIFLRNKSITPENIVDHICYICEMVGTDYVGLGTDYVFEHEKTLMLVDQYPENFPNPMQYKEIKILHPRSIVDVFEELSIRGFSSSCLEKIMGGNFFRVAKESWSPSC